MSNGLLIVPALVLLATLTGCATSSSQVSIQQQPPRVVDGTADDSVHTVIQSSDDQIYKSEHVMDPGASAQNQDIP